MFFSLALEVAGSSLNTESNNRICPKLAASYYNCQKDYVHFYYLRKTGYVFPHCATVNTVNLAVSFFTCVGLLQAIPWISR